MSEEKNINSPTTTQALPTKEKKKVGRKPVYVTDEQKAEKKEKVKLYQRGVQREYSRQRLSDLKRLKEVEKKYIALLERVKGLIPEES
jgi:hypothetical protein